MDLAKIKQALTLTLTLTLTHYLMWTLYTALILS